MDAFEIEQASRRLIERIWNNRHVLFPSRIPERIQMLEPRVACVELGIAYDPHPSLPWYTPRGIIEIAGLLDREGNRVCAAQKYGPVVERFTAAHELGHYLLHPDEIMHRDVPDGGRPGAPRARVEREADYFAACFLIPANILREEFEHRFGPPESFTFDEDSGFWLTPADPERLMGQGSADVRALAIATNTKFNGRSFASLCQHFRVSRKAMAIRLLETDLVRGFP